MIEESGLDPFESEELATFLMMLESLVDESAPAPAPTPALAAMLAGGATGVGASVVALAARRHQNALAAAVLAVTGIVATGAAAAANDLPSTAQRIVADFSQRFLPFDFPYPEERSERLAGDPENAGEPSTNADDGAAQAGVQDYASGHEPSAHDGSDRESGDVTPESETRDDESGTQANDSDGSGPREQPDVKDSDDSSSGESEDEADGTTTAGDDSGTADTSGESGGDDGEPDVAEPDDAEPEGDTLDSSEAIDD